MRQYTLDSGPARAPRESGFLRDLNPEQRRVAEARGGPLLVLAGAGTGKTRALTYRTAHLVHQGVAPDRILLLTFTNRAAREMIERVTRLVPGEAKRIWAGTFHAIANRILRQHADRLGYGTNYVILDPQEARDLMEVVVADTLTDLTSRRFPKREVLLAMLSSAVNTDRGLRQVVEADHPQFQSQLPQIDQVLTAYLAAKVEMNAMDYDDLLVNLRLMLEDHDDLRGAYAQRFQHVLVDEYQDTNRLQAAIVALLSGHHRNVMVVGDDCQSIYAFRGADVRNILDFPKLFEGAEIHRLQTNYRSTPQILEVANRSIKHNRRQYEKTLSAVREAGELPAFVALADADQQAAFVAQRVLVLRVVGVGLVRLGVLYRAHYQSMELQLELPRRGIPFIIRSGAKFFEQAHIRDLLAHLRVLFNPLDRLAWTRVLKLQDGVGNKHATGIFQALASTGDPWTALLNDVVGPGLPGRARRGYARAREVLLALGRPELTGNPAAMFDHLLDAFYAEHLRQAHPNAEQRIEDVRQMAHFAGQFADYTAFLEELALVESVSAEEVVDGGPTDEKLLLSTVHQAKGLEWDAVFALHLADGQFPLRRALRTDDELEEERRLFYVAVTRARRDLYLCFPQWGNDREQRRVLQRPSRFLAELPHSRGDLVETWRISEG